MDKPNPLSVPINTLREAINEEVIHGHEFNRVYGDATIYGDINYVMSKVSAARDKKVGTDHSKSEYKHGETQEVPRPDLVAGELEYALERCNELIEKLESVEESDEYRDKYEVLPRVRKVKETIIQHKNAAEDGIIYK